MENLSELCSHYRKKFHAVRAFSNDDNEIGVVLIFCGEAVIKRGDMEATVRKVKCYTINHKFCVALIMEKTRKHHGKSWNLILGNCWEPCFRPEQSLKSLFPFYFLMPSDPYLWNRWTHRNGLPIKICSFSKGNPLDDPQKDLTNSPS